MPGRDIFQGLEDPQPLNLSVPASNTEGEKKDTKESKAVLESTTKPTSVLKKSILQPAAEIPTSSHVVDSDVSASTLIARAAIPSISEVLAEPAPVDSESADRKDVKASLTTMSSPLTSPIPGPRTSSLSHRNSNASISSITRRVTFSPDVIDNSETRTTPLRPKRLSRKKSVPLKASPLAEPQTLSPGEAETAKATESADIVDTVASLADVEVAAVAASVVEVQDETGYESDEAEFVEAQSELFDDTPEETSDAVNEIVDVTAVARREAEKEQMLVDMRGYYVGHEEIWRTATDSFVSELNMTQVKAVLVFVLVAVYASGLLAM